MPRFYHDKRTLYQHGENLALNIPQQYKRAMDLRKGTIIELHYDWGEGRLSFIKISDPIEKPKPEPKPEPIPEPVAEPKPEKELPYYCRVCGQELVVLGVGEYLCKKCNRHIVLKKKEETLT